MSKHKAKVVIRIVNPLPGGSAYTSPRRAHYFVSIGRAEPAGVHAIRFVPMQEQRIQIAAELRLRFIRMGLNPDDVEAGGRATVNQAQGIPLAGPAMKLFEEGKAHFTPRAERCGPVRQIHAPC